MKITLTADAYVAIMRAAFHLEKATAIAQGAQLAVQQADAALFGLLRAQGLDPTKPVRYNDLDLTIEEVDPGKTD